MLAIYKKAPVIIIPNLAKKIFMVLIYKNRF